MKRSRGKFEEIFVCSLKPFFFDMTFRQHLIYQNLLDKSIDKSSVYIQQKDQHEKLLKKCY